MNAPDIQTRNADLVPSEHATKVLRPIVWLIRYMDRRDRPQAVVHTHNPIADYRVVDPEARSTPINVLGAVNLVEAVENALLYGLTDPHALEALQTALRQAKDTAQ